MPYFSLILTIFLGCNGDTSDISNNTDNSTTENLSNTAPNTGTPTTAPTGDPTQSTAKGSPLPDLKQGLDRKGCDNGPGQAGAASYFVGELIIKDNQVYGNEEWVLFANEKWQKLGGKDCNVNWSLHGSTVAKQACGRCDTGVSLTNTMDITGSTCPEDMAKGETGQQIGYDIDLKDDGTVDIFFAKSGKKVGEGYHKDGTIRYVTDMSCRWF